MSANEGVGFYEILRYVLPGALLALLLNVLAVDLAGFGFDTPAWVVAAAFLGLVVRAVSPYQLLPKARKARTDAREHVERVTRRLQEGGFDALLLVMSDNERMLYRRYHALGTLRLDMTVLLALSAVATVGLFAGGVLDLGRAHALGLVGGLAGTAMLLYHDGIRDLERSHRIFRMAASQNAARACGLLRAADEPSMSAVVTATRP